MKFGKLAHIEGVDFRLPEDHKDTKQTLNQFRDQGETAFYIGCSNWNRTNLKGFYPRGTKDELSYYATQFNSIELNATFYRIFPVTTFENWYNKVPEGFKFFPKLNQEISHWKRLLNTDGVVQHFVGNAANLKEKLGCFFLQMHNNFSPKDFDRVVTFMEAWPSEFPLAVECRHTDWYNDTQIAPKLYSLLEAKSITNIIVDTAGRRDLLHMRLTSDTAFVRFVCVNEQIDYERLDDWVERLKAWKQQGLQYVYFFIHQDITKEDPLKASYFIDKLNTVLGMTLKVPQKATSTPPTLF